MLKILIIEDEEPAAKRLEKMIREEEPAVELIGNIVSVADGIIWFNENKSPDLVFSDIQLSDGISFELFKKAGVTCPVIFVTAYDEYAIDAFKLNSIDYLLKPVKKEDLHQAMQKFRKLRTTQSIDIDKLLSAYSQSPRYRQRFIVRYGEHLKTVLVEEVAYFYTEDKIHFLTTTEGRRFAIDFNLDSLESMVDPKVFFRINRQFIISIHAIAEMFAYSKSRVLVKLQPPSKHETIVSTERSAQFKAWLGDSN